MMFSVTLFTDLGFVLLTDLRLRKVITCLVLVDLEIALVDLGELKEKKGNTSIHF